MGNAFDMVGTLFGGKTDEMRAQERALEMQRQAQEKQMKMQQGQLKLQQAQQKQALDKANKQVADAAAAVEEAGVINESNLTGGLGIDPSELQLGAPTLLGEDEKKEE